MYREGDMTCEGRAYRACDAKAGYSPWGIMGIVGDVERQRAYTVEVAKQVPRPQGGISSGIIRGLSTIFNQLEESHDR